MRKIAVATIAALSLAGSLGFANAQESMKASPATGSYGTGTPARSDSADSITPSKDAESSYGTGTAARASSGGPTETGAATGAKCADGKTPGAGGSC
ncbi:hypothetical protein ACFQI3_12525 [Hansschlegelia quercus]|uniref:Oxidoreductase n=1 Tax=Hansschlegelia quercus TaxID=2528245 RepID=A0A4Q9GGS2_9HYPH|nr:hypothetical protein [Hansschlegelia quercus]TBN53329.1 hypothetical protein EYR15_09915 [Hansschlegelia quercus]